MNWKRIIHVSAGALIGVVLGRLLVGTITVSWTVTMALCGIAGALIPEIVAWLRKRKTGADPLE